MRILYLNHDQNRTGTTIALVNILQGMVKRGHEVFVIKPCGEGFLEEKLRKEGIPFISLPLRCMAYPQTKNIFYRLKSISGLIWRKLSIQNAIEKIIQDFNPDIIHTNSGLLDVALTPCLKMHKPHIWHIREAAETLGLYPFPSSSYYNRRLQNEGNYNIAVSHFVFNYRKLRPSKDIVIYDGVFSKSNTIYPVRKEKTILYIGAITEYKGVATLLHAFCKFHQQYPSFKLSLIGQVTKQNESFYYACLAFIERNNLQACVTFLGSRNNTYELISKASAVVVPTFHEGFGFVTAEAMLNKTFVIGRDSAGTKEQMDICKKETGLELAYRFSSQEDLVKGLCYVAKNDTSVLCEKARLVVLEKYSVEENCTRIENFYKWVLKDYYG